MLIPIAEITPISDYGREKCPFNCAECKYFNGISLGEIDCDLEEETE